MRKFLFLALMCVITSQLLAQTEKGNILIGASSNLGFSVQSQDGLEDNIVNFSLSAQGGYFIVDNLVGGLNIGLNSTTIGDFSGRNFSFGPFARYYFENVFFGASFFAVNSKNDVGGGEVFTSNGTQFNLELGYAAFLNKYVALEPTITYLTTGGDLNIGGLSAFALNIGFSIYL